MPFTETGAWHLVAQLLEAGHPCQEVVLDRPVGKRAYVLLADLPGASSTLYIKVHLGSGRIIGRSFHYSDRAGLHGTPFDPFGEDL